jgi:hypothetical protein
MKKSWPADAVMIVAAALGTEDRSHMDSVVLRECRDCGGTVAVEEGSITAAEAHPLRHGRPVLYYCVECAVEHDMRQITELVDRRY